MPVHDNPVDPRTVKGEGHRYGCNSKPPLKDGFWASDRTGPREYRQLFIKHTMSKLCRYDQRANDKGCDGCTCESDEEYLKGYGL